MPGDISGGAVSDLSQSRCANKSPNPMRGTAEGKVGFALGSPRLLLIPFRSGSDLWKRNSGIFLIIVVSIRLSLRRGHSLGYRCSGPGLMFTSIQAMSMAVLCHPGQLATHGDAYLANVLSHQSRLAALLDLEWPRPGPPVLNSRPSAKRPRRSRPDVRGAVAADGTPKKTAARRAPDLRDV